MAQPKSWPSVATVTAEATWLKNLPSVMLPLVERWPTVCTDGVGQTQVIKQSIYATDEVLVRCRAYRVSPMKKAIMKEHLDKMLDDGVIEPSDSTWSVPAVLTA